MYIVERYYDSYWQEHRWMIKHIDPDTGNDIPLPVFEKRYLQAKGFTILNPSSATNDTMIDYSEAKYMARDLNRMS